MSKITKTYYKHKDNVGWHAVQVIEGSGIRIINIIYESGGILEQEPGAWHNAMTRDCYVTLGFWLPISRKEAMKPVKNKQSRIARRKQRADEAITKSELASAQRHIDTQENG